MKNKNWMSRLADKAAKNHKYKSMYMEIAEVVSRMSYAKRLQVGCVIVKDDRIISMGWNGMPSGFDNECEDHNSETRPEVLHAESNAIAKLARSPESGEGAIAFITHQPCMGCAKLLYQSGIKKVYFARGYRSCEGVQFLEKCNIEVEKIDGL